MQPTEEQETILSKVGNISVKARVATGKTTLCKWKVEQALDGGMNPDKILYLGWLRAYRREAQARFGNLPVKVRTIHSHRFRNRKDLREEFLNTGDYEMLLGEVIPKEKTIELLILDECQDLSKLLYSASIPLVSETGSIFMVGDDRQRKDFSGEEFDPFLQFMRDFDIKPMYMRGNHRNAKEIIAAFERLYPDGVRALNNIEGKVVFDKPDNFHNMVILGRTNAVIKQFSADFPHKHCLRYREDGKYHYEGDFRSTCKIMTIYQFSGRESDRVWLLDWDTGNSRLEKNLYFIALSRARKKLYITYTDTPSTCYNRVSIILQVIEVFYLINFLE